MTARPILIGMSNPHSSDPRHALWPVPENATGHRLWKMLSDWRGGRASLRDYADGFDRRNLADGSGAWDADGARYAAALMRQTFRHGQTVVLLGDQVRRAFGIKKLLLHPQVVDGVAYRCVPHPSGRNLFYNDPALRALVGMLLDDLLKTSE